MNNDLYNLKNKVSDLQSHIKELKAEEELNGAKTNLEKDASTARFNKLKKETSTAIKE